MGVIQRQSIKHSIVSVIGIAIGALSILFVYHKDRELYGILSFITSTSSLLLPFLSLGITTLTIKYFPLFKSKSQKHQGYLGILFSFTVIGIFCSTFLLFLSKDILYDFLALLKFKVEDVGAYKLPIYGVTISLIFSRILTSYISNFGRVAIPNALNNLLLKVALPIIVLLHISSYISLSQAINLYMLTYVLILTSLIFYTIHLKEWHIQPKFGTISKPLARDMFSFAFFNILSSTGSIIANQIDGIMISTLIDFENNGDYNIFLFMANTVSIAYLALVAIANPIVSEKIKSNELEAVDEIYKKTSLHALLVGMLILIGLWCNMNDILRLMGKFELYQPIAVTFLFLAGAKLFDAATSVNTQIIAYSKYYRFNLVMVLILATLTIITNYVFLAILNLGIIGAAMATCLSVLLYNLVKMIFIWAKYRMLPFSKATLVVLAVSGVLLALGLLLSFPFSPIVNIVLRSALIAGIFVFAIYQFRVSEEVNALILKYWKMVFG
ncbi:MAG: oligosaccharide flippase family protein [Bacteroidota bacterium]